MNNKYTQIIIGLLVVLLIGASFAIGVMYNEIQNNKKTGTGAAPQGTGAAAPTGAAPSEVLSAAAKIANLNEKDFNACLANNPQKSFVTENNASGVAAGINGTPGIILYSPSSKAALLVPGAYPIDAMNLFIDIMRTNPSADSAKILELSKAQAEELSPGSGANLSTPAAVEALKDRDHVRGPRNAKIQMIEYSDFNCGFCKRFHVTAKQVVEENQDVAWGYRHRTVLGAASLTLAEGSECAYEQGGHDAFWAMADALLAQ